MLAHWGSFLSVPGGWTVNFFITPAKLPGPGLRPRVERSGELVHAVKAGVIAAGIGWLDVVILL
jgi:hypothetical protein